MISRATTPLDLSGTVDPAVMAEYTLRRLAVVCTEAAAEPYRGRTRLTEWNVLVSQTRAEYDEVARLAAMPVDLSAADG